MTSRKMHSMFLYAHIYMYIYIYIVYPIKASMRHMTGRHPKKPCQDFVSDLVRYNKQTNTSTPASK